MRRGLSLFNVTSLALGLAFLYLPILILVIYSFNASRLVTVWGGWSTRWYVSLLGNQAMLDAAWISLRIAFLTACAATVLGTLAALALVRAGRFRGRLLFSGLVYAPLVMPEVITGLALLLLFVAIEIERGFWTVTIAHTTLTMGFVTVIVQARLLGFDRSLEEAAMDLGCPPLRTFLTVTLPLIAPAIAAGWVLAFMLSLDDLVIANFTTGPGATTLPIRIYSEVRLGVRPEINAICTIIIAVVAIGIVAASLLTKFSGHAGRQPIRRAAADDAISRCAGAAGGTDRPRTTPARSPARRASGSAAPRSCPAARAPARAPASGRTRRIELLGRDAEMGHDRAHDQRCDRELDQRLHEIRGPSPNLPHAAVRNGSPEGSGRAGGQR